MEVNEKIYATQFRSPLEATHKVMNFASEIGVEALRGTHAECLAFLSGLEHADNSGTSLWFDCVIYDL